MNKTFDIAVVGATGVVGGGVVPPVPGPAPAGGGGGGGGGAFRLNNWESNRKIPRMA